MLNSMKDSFGRAHTYVRIAVTEHCNLSCRYCRPVLKDTLDSRRLPAASTVVLTDDDIVSVVSAMAEMGVMKVRLTGGEPLLRPGLAALAARLRAINGIQRLGVTTNGMLLAAQAHSLWEAGVTDVNISLNSLRPATFAAITGADAFDRVWKGLEASLAAGFERVKLNVVYMHGTNDDEVEDFLRLTLSRPVAVRFIEYMPIGRSMEGWAESYKPLTGILEHCERVGWRYEAVTEPGSQVSSKAEGCLEALGGPAHYYRIDGAAGCFGLISPISEHFCATCNRLRLTADGYIKSCLYWNEEFNIRPYLGSHARLKQALQRALDRKPLRHDMEASSMPCMTSDNSARSMYSGCSPHSTCSTCTADAVKLEQSALSEQYATVMPRLQDESQQGGQKRTTRQMSQIGG